MLFVLSSYGDNFVPFLATTLESIRKTHPHDRVIALWDDTSDFEIQLLKNSFPEVDFIHENANISDVDSAKKIPVKLRFWAQVCKNTREQYICFLDSDMIVHKNISKYLDTEVDFIYTFKHEKFPINAGLVIVKNSEKMEKFFDLWCEKNEELLSDDSLFEAAKEENGGANQHSLIKLINLADLTKGGDAEFDFGTIKFKAVPCDELNQTNSVPISFGSSVFHYKGGWRPIILEGADFSVNRPKENSYEMKIFWENMYENYHNRMFHKLSNKVLNKNFNAAKDFHELIVGKEGLSILPSEAFLMACFLKEFKIDPIILSKDNSSLKLIQTVLKIFDIKSHHTDISLLESRLKKDSKSKAVIYVSGENFDEDLIVIKRAVADFPNLNMLFFTGLWESKGKFTNAKRDQVYASFYRTITSDLIGFPSDILDLDSFVNQDKVELEKKWDINTLGLYSINSYGPTLGIVFPNSMDRFRIKAL